MFAADMATRNSLDHWSKLARVAADRRGALKICARDLWISPVAFTLINALSSGLPAGGWSQSLWWLVSWPDLVSDVDLVRPILLTWVAISMSLFCIKLMAVLKVALLCRDRLAWAPISIPMV